MVTKPGHMAACAGCRFIGNCPAKIEILRSIRTPDTALGVMTITTFSQEGHDRITHDTQTYVDALHHYTDWIADLARLRHKTPDEAQALPLLKEVMELSGESFLAVNPRGEVVQCNAGAHAFFSFCDLYTRSVYHILPHAVADKILEGNPIRDTRLVIQDRTAWLSANPIFEGDSLTGAVIRIRHQRPPKANAPKKNKGRLLTDKAILGNSPAILELKKMVKKLKRSQSTLLITGETGTGKGLLAKVIHHTGDRRDGPFVPVNCASIPETLFESELFGYEEGAFTGAKKGGKPGRFELAQGGTLFLDEIGEMPLHMQVKLLNVLQDQSLQRVGGITPVPIDVRIIAATNQDLDHLVQEKLFRADLFYRLNVIPMELPPLVRRPEDIALLAQAFLEEFNPKARKKIQAISPPVMELLQSHAWPGNIRELQNIMEYSINMEEGKEISRASLPPRFLAQTRSPLPPAPGTDIKTRVATTEKDTILACLDRHGHDVEGKKKT
ncbi:MAG: sigma 54-interacting transcriptional regulator, partial [Desulfobacterales bacterium]|nr:sigma 54-interacting transcriptional regulator [Desulfobacterales bacterium]